MSGVIGGGKDINFKKIDSKNNFTNFFGCPTINSFNNNTDISYFDANNSDFENDSPQMQFDEYLDLLKDYGVTDEDLIRVKNSEITLQELLIEIDKDPNKVRLIQQNSFLKQINQNLEKQYDSYSDFVIDVNSEKEKLTNLVKERNNINDSFREYDELQWFCNRLKSGEDLKYLLDSAACYKYTDGYGNVVYIYPEATDGFLNYNSEIFDKKAEEVTFEEYFKNSELFNELKNSLSQEKRWTLLGKKDFTLYTGTSEQDAIITKIENLYKENYDNRKIQLEEYDKNIETQKKYSDKLSGTKEYVDNQVDYYINNIHAYTSKDDFLEKSTYDKSKNQVLTKSIYELSKNKNDVVDFYSCLINGEIIEKNGVICDKNGKYICDSSQLSTIDNLLDNYLKWETFISDTEKDIFNYILNTEGTDKAYEYLENISDELDNRWLADKCQKDKEFAQEHEVLASVGSIFLTPVEGLNAAAYSLNSKITGEKIHRSDVYSKGNVWRQSVSEEIHEYSSAWGFIYDTGMSMADSGLLIAASAATGGSASWILSTTLIGSRAYVSTLNDALDRGLSDNQAILLAASSAIVETAMENYSLGHLMNLEEKLGENTLKFTGKIGSKINNPKIANLVEKSFYILASSASQGIAEGEEEFCTELLNYGLDIFISKDLSNYAQSMERYISEGKSEYEALLLTMKDFFGQLGQAFFGGFASGFCFGAFGGANSTIKTSYAISNNMYTKFLGENVSFSDAINFNRQQLENLSYASNEFSNLQKNNETSTVDLTSLTEEQIDLLNNGTIEQQAGKEIKANISNNISNVVETIGNQQIGESGLFTVKDFAMILPDFGVNVFDLIGRKSLGSNLTAEQNQQVLTKIKEEGIVHITNEESAGLILDTNYVKKTKAGIQSYGAAKSFFFAGTPTIEGVAFNLDSLKTVITGVRIQPTDMQMNDLKVRYSDGSIFNKGDFNFESGQAEQVYYGLTFEDGNLVYKEITEEQAQNYQPDITSEQLKILQNKWALGLKAFISGMQADRIKLLNDIKNYKGTSTYNEVTEQIGNIEVETNNHTDVNQTISVDNNLQSEILETNETDIVKNDFALQDKKNYYEFSNVSDFASSINVNGLLNETGNVISFSDVTLDFGVSSKYICEELKNLGITSENVTNLTNSQISDLCDLLSYYSRRIVGVDYVFDEASKLLEDYQLKISKLYFDNVIGKVNLFNEYMVNLSNLIIENNNLNVGISETIDSKKLSTSSVNVVDYSIIQDEKEVIVDVLQKTNNLKDLSYLSNMDYSDKLILKKYLKSGAAKTLLTVNQEQFNALFSYMSGQYRYINKYLDTGIDCDLAFGLKASDAVRLIDEVMFNNTVGETCIMQRQSTISDFEGLSFEELPGKILTHNRNRSTCSGDISTVGTERGGNGIGMKEGEQKVKIDYICPDGTRAVNLGMITSNQIENEILIGRNQRIRYDSVKMDGDTACVLAVVLPDGVSDNVSIRDLVDAKTYDIISSRYDLSENIEVLEIKSTNNDNLLTATSEQFDQVLDKIEQNAGIEFIKDLRVEEFQEVLSKVSKDKYLSFSSILSQDTILNNMNKITQESYDKLVDIILSNPYDTFVLSRNEDFLNIFANRSNDNTLLQILESNSNFALKLFNKIDTTKLNYLLSNIKNKSCFDDIFKHFYNDEIMMNSETEAINVYNILNENGFATDIVNDYFSWLANDNAYNINVSYKTSVENNNGVYSIRRMDGTNFNLKYLNTQELSNGNTVYSYEYTSGNSSVILYVDYDLSFMLDENLNIEQLVNDFLSVECIEQSINEYGYLGTYKLNSGKYEQVINKDNIGLIINETANQYYDFLDTYYDLNAGNTFGVDQHSTANMAKVNPKAFKELCKKFVSKGLSYRDAIKIMKSLDNTGACSYASVCNTIFGFYKDNPQAFKSDFGFDMFVYNSEYNYYSLNTTELLADLYLYVNNKSNNPNANLFEGIDKIKIVDKTWLGDIKTDNQQYLSGGWGVRVDLINKYLQSKNKSLDFNSETLHYGQTINNLSDLEINEVRKIIGDSLATGKTVGLGIYRDIYDTQGNPTKKGNIRFINADGNVYVDTNSWSEGDGHAVFITSVVENGVWVSSWGKKLYISFSDLQNASFRLYQNFIKGING